MSLGLHGKVGNDGTADERAQYRDDDKPQTSQERFKDHGLSVRKVLYEGYESDKEDSSKSGPGPNHNSHYHQDQPSPGDQSI